MPRGIPGSGPNAAGLRATITPAGQRRRKTKKIKAVPFQQGRMIASPNGEAAQMIRELVNQRVDQIIAEALNS